MADVRTAQRHLTRVQLRRKQTIWLVSLGFVPLIVFTDAVFAPGSWQRVSIEGSGSVLLLIAIVGRVWSSMYIGGRKTAVLVDSGPYSVSRNPLYLFTFIGVAGLGAQTGSISIALMMSAIAYVIFLQVVLREEAALSSIHGSVYLAYRREVPRFVPQFASWRDLDLVTVNPRIVRRTIEDALVFVLFAVIVRVVSQSKQYLPGWAQIQLF